MYRTKSEWTYYDVFKLTSYGNGAAYALDYINVDSTITEVTFLQDECDVHTFEQELDACTNVKDFATLWQEYYYNTHDDFIQFGTLQNAYLDANNTDDTIRFISW